MSEDVLVDTNVLLDVLNSDSEWGNWSEQRLGKFANRLVINPIIYTELCYTAADAEQVDTAVNILGLAFKEMSKEALF
jgi:predicted nucleic acid-binding protein